MTSEINSQPIADKLAGGIAAAKDLSAVGKRQFVDEVQH